MTIKAGDKLPDGKLSESTEFDEAAGCPMPPHDVGVADALKGKKVDEIWCVATNDAFVMAAWGRDQKAGGKIRMLGDGSVQWTKALGLELDLTARNMGVRSQRYSMLVENGVVKKLNVEAPGKYEVSGAETMLSQL